MDTREKSFCDHLLTLKSTLLVHIRSCDNNQLPLSYIYSIGNVSQNFKTVVLTGGCHADERYATQHEAFSNLENSVEKVYTHMREFEMHCKLRFFPNYNPDDALYAFRVALNILVERGGFAALAVLLTQGSAFLDQPMKTYYDNADFKNLVSSKSKLLWKRDDDRNESNSGLDHVAQVVPTNCLFELVGAASKSKRMCMTESVNDEQCWVLSNSYNGLVGFETFFFSNTKCSVHVFDCTGDWQVPKNMTTRVFIHHICIGPKKLSNGDRSFLPYEEVVSLATNKVNVAPTYFKLDFQGDEFQLLHAILASPRTIQPIQIGFELRLTTSSIITPLHEHHHKDDELVDKEESAVAFLFFMLKGFGGYEVISREDDPTCQTCAEFVVMKSRKIT